MILRSKLILSTTVVLFTATLVVQRSRLIELKTSLAENSAKLQAAAGLSRDKSDGAEELEEMIALLKAETSDLHRLRNEVSSLRSQKLDPQRLRQENTVLAARLAESAKTKPPPAPKDLTLSTLKNAGLATPQAAVETFFWSMCNADLEKLFRACPMLEKEIGRNAEAEKAFREYLPQIRNGFTGYNFSETEHPSPTTAEVKLLTISGKIMKVPLQLNGAEWKVTGFPE